MISRSSELSEERGQASVEAAFLMPVSALLLLLLIQPICLLYTTAVMWEAASETARAALAASSIQDLEEYALRRLAAVPDIGIFHAGSWDIAVSGMEEETVTVTISGHADALPLVGTLAAIGTGTDGEGLVLEVVLEERLRPSWLEGSYDEWIEVWDHGQAAA